VIGTIFASSGTASRPSTPTAASIAKTSTQFSRREITGATSQLPSAIPSSTIASISEAVGRASKKTDQHPHQTIS
jgi:hypothetical protein